MYDLFYLLNIKKYFEKISVEKSQVFLSLKSQRYLKIFFFFLKLLKKVIEQCEDE